MSEFLGALDLGVRSQDLLDESGAGARQAEDENGIRIRHAPLLPCCEEFRRAHLRRQPGLGLCDLGQVANLGVLEGVAALIERPRFFISTLILQCFAQREAQVVSVYQAGGRRRFHGAHARDLIFSEAVGLEVGQAPPGLTRVRRGGDGFTIFLNGFRLPTDGSQQVCQPQVQVRGLGSGCSAFRQHLAVQANDGFVIAESHAGRRV